MGSNLPFRSAEGLCDGSINCRGHIQLKRLRRDIGANFFLLQMQRMVETLRIPTNFS